MITALFFYLFALMTVLAGFMVISARNPVHAVLFLILAFFNSAGLLILLGAEFLAMLLVVVYVGAVAVLFLFVVMMLDINVDEMRAGFLRHLPLGLLVGGILITELMLAFTYDLGNTLPQNTASPTGDAVIAGEVVDDGIGTSIGRSTGAGIGVGIDIGTSIGAGNGVGSGIGINGEADPVTDFASIPSIPPSLPSEVAIRSNTAMIGDRLYTEYLLNFQVAGLILLVAMIGAIALTMRERHGAKRQSITHQNLRQRQESVTLVSVETAQAPAPLATANNNASRNRLNNNANTPNNPNGDR
ncbi:MAG: NADH-quinone oxidoreductase subunit J [Proteobacteria bacterium]|nr:NADH-quinone oxidoreductase subunit J [Pseudomonadota bacterium]